MNTRAVNSLLTEADVLPKVNFMLGKFDDVYEKQKESEVHKLLGNPSWHKLVYCVCTPYHTEVGQDIDTRTLIGNS